MNTVERLFYVDKINVELSLPLRALLDDVAKREDVVYTPAFFSETSFFLPDLVRILFEIYSRVISFQLLQSHPSC